jgi:hypothetical protein
MLIPMSTMVACSLWEQKIAPTGSDPPSAL